MKINAKARIGKFTQFFSSYFIVALIISTIIIIAFGELTKTFYQQDEWFSLGIIYSEGFSSIFDGLWSPLDLLFVKGRILSSALAYLFLNYFPLQNTQLAIFAIILHLAATFLVYRLINKFFKSSLVALLGSIFFAVNSVSHGAVTWPVIALNTVTSTIVILLGLYSFLKYIETEKNKWLVVSGLLLYISLWFKETGIYLFFFLPLSALLFKKNTFKIFLERFWLFVLPSFLIIFYRIMELKSVSLDPNLYITGQNQNFFSTLIFRAILYPLTSFSLMFVPGEHFLGFAREILREIYPFFASAPNNIAIAQSPILDLLAVCLTFSIIILIGLLLHKETKQSRKIVYFWLMFTFMSFLPYILQSKDFSYLEGRYYYLSVVGGAVLLSWVLKRLWEIFGSRIFYIAVLPLCTFFLIFHAHVVQDSIKERVKIANLQKSFILQLKTLTPTLERDKNVFYATSDQNFWAEGNKLPFQQGSGYTLMVLYYNTGKIPNEFLKAQGFLQDGFLFDIGSQGYREVSDLGFGYFWDEQELDKAVKLYNLQEDSVIRLKYNSDANKLELQ